MSLLKDMKDLHCIKRNNSFLAMSIPQLKFLDVTNYLAAGTSYEKYLKAYDIPVAKGFFCYDYVTSYEVLVSTKELPPYEAFYSKLNLCNVLDEGEDEQHGR